MGTNYYLHEKPPCECCGRPHEPLHIGKSSGGWVFLLHVIPEQSINTLDDWRDRWCVPGAVIKSEYGDTVTIEDMERIITQRRRLRRNFVDGGHCVGKGEGTWDYIAGEFS